MDIIKRFSDRLNDLIKEKGITAYELTKELNIPHSTAQAWFVGKSFPSVNYLLILAEYFGCSTDYLLGVTDY